MINKLLGIDTLENTEPVELEEVPDVEAPQMPAEFDHTVPETDQYGDAVVSFDPDAEDGE